MAQAYVNISKMEDREKEEGVDNKNNRRIGVSIDGCHHVSIYKNDDNQVVLNIRRQTRSVTISKHKFLQICELKETLQQCCDFIES